MADRALPGLGLKGFWDLGEDNWKDDNDLNLLKLSVLVQGSFIDKVAAEPGAPAEGNIYVLDETNATHPNNIAVYDSAAWVYIAAMDGMLLWNATAGYYEKFDVTAGVWAELATGGGAVNSVVAGTGIAVDNTDPANPVVSATGGGGGSDPGLAAHRYWIIDFYGSRDFASSIAEIQMRATAGGANQCTGGTAFASAVDVGAAANAFDGSASTFWGTAPTGGASGNYYGPAYIGYDFGAGNAKVVQQVVLTARPSPAGDQMPQRGRVMYSDDNLTYYTAFEYTRKTVPADGEVATITNPAA